MAVSIPEKTLEHWASTYILHRYHTKVPLWWPTSRADIEVGDLGYQAGKAFWLELKTATWNPSKATHVVKVDLWQLWKYSQQHIPVYYAFPIPQWSDTLTSPPGKAWLGGMQRSNLAFWRGAPRTFYRWMFVVPGWNCSRTTRRRYRHFSRKVYSKRPRHLCSQLLMTELATGIGTPRSGQVRRVSGLGSTFGVKWTSAAVRKCPLS